MSTDTEHAPASPTDLGPVVRAFMVKGVRHDGPVSGGLHWATARRGQVVFRERGLECWSWKVPYDQVEQARVEWFRSSFGKGPVLCVRTRAGVNYQFGMNPSAFWKSPDLPLAIEVTDTVHGSAARAWALRLLLIAMVGGIAALWAYRALSGG